MAGGAGAGCAKEHHSRSGRSQSCVRVRVGGPDRAPVQYGENRRQPDPLPNQHQRPISKNKDPQNDMQMFSKQYSLKALELIKIAFKMLTFVCSSFQLFADRSLSCLIDMAGWEDAKTHVDFLSRTLEDPLGHPNVITEKANRALQLHPAL